MFVYLNDSHGSEKTDYTKVFRLNAEQKQEGYRTMLACLPLNKGVKVVVLYQFWDWVAGVAGRAHCVLAYGVINFWILN